MKVANKIIEAMKPLDKAMADLEKKIASPEFKKQQAKEREEAEKKLAQLKAEREKRERESAKKKFSKEKNKPKASKEDLLFMTTLGRSGATKKELKQGVFQYTNPSGKFAMDVIVDLNNMEVKINKAQTDDKLALTQAAKELGFKVKG